MRIGLGLDLAGYSTGKSELAYVEYGAFQSKVFLIKESPFAQKRRSDESRLDAEREDAETLTRLVSLAPTAVDVPIDLQGLPNNPTSSHIWGQTKRPIDFALSGLAPYSDRIGYVVARFGGALAKSNLANLLGVRLFETYPAACLVALGTISKGYKSNNAGASRSTISRALGLDDVTLTDDEIDATVCALTAAADPSDCFEGDELSTYARTLSGLSNALPPKGYRLLRRRTPNPITVTRIRYAEWMGGVV